MYNTSLQLFKHTTIVETLLPFCYYTVTLNTIQGIVFALFNLACVFIELFLIKNNA